MEKNIEDFLKNNPEPSNEDLANFLASLEVETASTPTADKLLAPGAAMYESHMFHPRVPKDNTGESSSPSVPASPDAGPEKQKVSLRELYQWLDSRLTFTQNTFDTKNSPIILKIFEKDFKVTESVAKQVIEKLKKFGVIDRDGKINKGALNTEIKDRDEVWEFAGKPYEPTTPTVPAPLPVITPDDSLSSIFKRVGASTTGGPDTAPTTPDTLNTTLIANTLLDFLIEKVKTGDDSLTVEELQKKFNISEENAKTVIKDLKSPKIGLLVKNKLVEISLIENIKKTFDMSADILKPDHPDAPVKPAPVDTTATAVPLATPATGPLPSDASAGLNPAAAPATPAVAPGATIEKGALNEMYTALKTYAGKIVKNKPAIITFVLFAAFTGAKLYESGKEVHSENGEQGITAPINKDQSKSIKTGEMSGKSQGATSLESLNPNFENTRWWKELDQETKINIKWLLGTNDPQTWALKFFEKVEVVGEPEKKELSHDEQIFLYNKLITNPNLLVESYSKNEGLVESCIVKMKNTNCYPRENVANIIVEIYKIFRVTDPQNVQEDLSFLLDPKNPKTITKTFIWTQERLKTIIAANTKQ